VALRLKLPLTALLLVAAVGVHSPAGATQPSSSDQAAAQSLFDEAKALAVDQKWAEACPKLEESQRRDPRMVTLYRLADCYEHVGRPASAWMLFLDAASRARDAGEVAREKVASDRASALERALPRLAVVVPPVPGIQVTRDGATLSPEQWGVRVPVDPGAHAVVASAPGKKGFNTVATVSGAGAVVTVSIPVLADSELPMPSDFASTAPVPEESFVGAIPSGAAPAGARPTNPTPESGRTGLLIGGGVTLGVGVAIVSAAAVLFATGSQPANGSCPFRKCELPGLLFWPGLTFAVAGGAIVLAGAISKPAVAVSFSPTSAVVGARF
jgi:hypothetical protein